MSIVSSCIWTVVSRRMIKSSMVDDHSSVLRPGYNPLTHVLDVKRRGNDAGCPQDFGRGKFARNRGLMRSC